MRTSRISAAVFICTLVAVPRASASLITIGIGAFPMGSTLTTFTGLALGTEVNGLAVDATVGPGGAILFHYSLGNGTASIGVGPNTTNNINQPGIVSNPGANNSGVLSMTFPSLVDTFGYGYALLGTGTIPNGTTLSLFDGATSVGSLWTSRFPVQSWRPVTARSLRFLKSAVFIIDTNAARRDRAAHSLRPSHAAISRHPLP